MLGDEEIKEEIFSIDETLARRVYEEGRGEKWLKSERENGVDNLTALTIISHFSLACSPTAL